MGSPHRPQSRVVRSWGLDMTQLDAAGHAADTVVCAEAGVWSPEPSSSTWSTGSQAVAGSLQPTLIDLPPTPHPQLEALSFPLSLHP